MKKQNLIIIVIIVFTFVYKAIRLFIVEDSLYSAVIIGEALVPLLIGVLVSIVASVIQLIRKKFTWKFAKTYFIYGWLCIFGLQVFSDIASLYEHISGEKL